MTDTVRFEVSGPVATITLNRPDRLNAMTEELIAAVLALLEQVSADEAIRVLVLTGAGRGFCAGGDLGAMGEFAEPRTPGASIAQLRRLHRTTELLHEMPKPTIAAVNGPCAGAGLSWACACDLRIAAESAVFRTAFLSAGLTGDFGGTWLLTRLVGAGRARDLYFRNEKLGAAAALSMGLVGEVVPDGALLGRVADLAGRLAEAPPHVVAGIKQNLNDAEELDLHAVLNAEAERQVRAALSHPSALSTSTLSPTTLPNSLPPPILRAPSSADDAVRPCHTVTDVIASNTAGYRACGVTLSHPAHLHRSCHRVESCPLQYASAFAYKPDSTRVPDAPRPPTS